MSATSSKVYVEYDPTSPPPHPGKAWTRFICISDTHSSSNFQVPPGDVLLHAGDLSSWGRLEDLQKSLRWITTLPHPIKILVAGNHDLCLDRQFAEDMGRDIFLQHFKAAIQLVRGPAAQAAGIHYLEHEATSFVSGGRRWKVYGSPAAPLYNAEGCFQYNSKEKAQEIYNLIPVDVDILLTHTPPHGVHDVTKRGKHAGCQYLTERLKQLDEGISERGRSDTPWSCKLHVWGHIHEAHGASITKTARGERVQVNAALYHSGLPIIVDLHNGGKYSKSNHFSDAMSNLSIGDVDDNDAHE